MSDKASDWRLEDICPECGEVHCGFVKNLFAERLTHLDARPDHVRRAEVEMWRENEKHERARI